MNRLWIKIRGGILFELPISCPVLRVIWEGEKVGDKYTARAHIHVKMDGGLNLWIRLLWESE